MTTATLDAPRAGESIVDDKLDSIKRDAESRYQDLVFALATGERQVDPIELRDILNHAEQSRDDLNRHLEIARSGIEARDNLRRAEQLAAELPALEAERDAINEEMRVLIQEHEARRVPLRDKQTRAVDACINIKQQASELKREARNVLRKTKSPEWSARFDRLSKRASRLLDEGRGADYTAAAAELDAFIAETFTDPKYMNFD